MESNDKLHKIKLTFILLTKKKEGALMRSIGQADEIIEKNRKSFNSELKMFINKKLYEKNIISEDTYLNAKEILIKQAG